MDKDVQVERKNINLLCKFVFKQKTGTWMGKQKWPVQGIQLSYGLEIKNIDNQPFKGGTISNFSIDIDSVDFHVSSKKKTAIQILNPNETTTVWVDRSTLLAQGNYWTSCTLTPDDPNIDISAHQVEEDGTYDIGEYDAANYGGASWGDGIYVIPKMDLLQARTNNLIALLTILMFVDSIIGLKAISLFLLNILSIILQFFLAIIQKLLI